MLSKAIYTELISLVKTKAHHTKPKLGTKFMHNTQQQSKFLTDLMFCLKMSGEWDSLISIGSGYHNFFPINLMVPMSKTVVLALGKARLLFSR